MDKPGELLSKNSTMISEMTKEDYPELIVLLAKCLDDVNKTGCKFKFNNESVFNFLKRGVEVDEYTGCFKFTENNKIVGIGILTVYPLWWDEDKLVAQEMAWHADPGLPAHHGAYIMADLYEAMENWAINYGVSLIKMSPNVDDRYSSVVRFLERRGHIKDTFATYKEVV